MMGLFDRLTGKKRGTTDAPPTSPPVMRAAGQETAQTAEQQQAIRARMEAEMTAQRERRTPPPA
jgi:hypothetical protein